MGKIKITRNTKTGQYVNITQSNPEYGWIHLEQIVVDRKGSFLDFKKRNHVLRAKAEILLKFIEKIGTTFKGSINVIECLENNIPSDLQTRIKKEVPFEEAIKPFIKKSKDGNHIFADGKRVLSFMDIDIDPDSKITDHRIIEDSEPIQDDFTVLYGICFGLDGDDSLVPYEIKIVLTEVGILLWKRIVYGFHGTATNHIRRSYIIESLKNSLTYLENLEENEAIDQQIAPEFTSTNYEIDRNEMLFETYSPFLDNALTEGAISFTENGEYLISIKGLFNLETLQRIDIKFNEISSKKLLEYFPSIEAGKNIITHSINYDTIKYSGKDIYNMIRSYIYGIYGGNLYIDKAVLNQALQEETIANIIEQDIFNESSLLKISEQYSLSDKGKEIILKYKLLQDHE